MSTPDSSTRLRGLVDNALPPGYEVVFQLMDLLAAEEHRWCGCATCHPRLDRLRRLLQRHMPDPPP